VTTTHLDIHSLPLHLTWNPGTAAATSVSAIMNGLEPIISLMMAKSIITSKPSFGFALATPDIDLTEVWDDPRQLIALVAYWGPEGPRYAANACRKLRPAAREGVDTEVLRREHPEAFRDIVESKEGDTAFPWGDFPWDGAAYTEVQGRRLLGAVSALPKEEDPIVARLITGLMGHIMFTSDQRLSSS
jgi:hypothetical protein